MSFISKLKDKLQTGGNTSKFSRIEKEIFNGNYPKAKNYLEEVKKDEIESEEEKLKYELLNTQITENMGNPAKALENCEELLKNYQNIENQELMCEIYIINAYCLFDLKKIQEAQDAITKSQEIVQKLNPNNLDSINELNGKIYYLLSKIAGSKREIQNSLDNMNKALEHSINSKNFDILGDIYGDLGRLYFMSQNPEKSVDSVLKGIDIFRKVNNKPKLLRYYNNIGMIYQAIQNKNKALEYYLLASNLLEESGDKVKPQLAVLSYNIGSLYLDRGEINVALTYINRAVKIFTEIDAKDKIASGLQITAVIYEMKGDLDLSLNLYNQAIQIFEELNIENELVNSYSNVGIIYYLKGELNQAVPYFEKSLELANKSGDLVQTSAIYYNLILSYLDLNNMDKANAYLEMLEELTKKDKNKAIDVNYRISKAHILRRNKRIIKRAEAQLIFQQLSFGEVINHQSVVQATFNLCEMLIQELRKSGNEEIIVEVKDAINKLIEIGESQNSYRYLVQAKLLQSKVALLELDLKTAKESMNEAQNIALEKGLDNLAMVISGEYDALINQLSKWTDLIDSNVSMIERLEMAELEGLVSNMVRNKVDNPEMLSEIPELFLVLNDQGMKVYSKVFTSESNLDDQVVGDLLTAVNSFIQETFSASGSIERLKHKEHTLMLKPIDKYLTCYVFKGQSYTALQKLEKFIDSVTQKEELYNSIIQSETEIVNDDLSSLVTDIFTAKAIAQN